MVGLFLVVSRDYIDSFFEGSTIDNSCVHLIGLLRDLFNHTAFFANLLGVDSDFTSKLREAHGRLMPFRIGPLGQIQEWAIDYDSNGFARSLLLLQRKS